MDIQVMHFVSLDDGNDICGDDRCFCRSTSGIWFETNGPFGDRYDQVECKTIALKLEAEFWKTMYKLK